MVNRKEIEDCFSKELKWIKDKKLREKVIDVWEYTGDKGCWKSINDVPFTLLIENSGRLTDHTKRITNLAKSVADLRDEEINYDYLIAGALLHDVGKLLEYVIENDKIVKGNYGKKFRHPVSGSKLAWIAGLPDEVVHIIYAHSHEGDNLNRSPEAVIVNHCDFIDFHIRKSMVEK